MINPILFFIRENTDIFEIKNNKEISKINWKPSLYDNFIEMAEVYYSSAHATLKEIKESNYSNKKSDMWFLAGIFLYRQAIELLCKSFIVQWENNNNEITIAFKLYKHDIESLISDYFTKLDIITINNDEQKWVLSYLKELEEIDKNSDLFRYPFKEVFLQENENHFIDILNVSKGMEQCYSILFKCVSQKYNPLKYENNINCSISTTFMYFTSVGIGNCQLYESPWSSGFYKQIEGYTNVADFIFNNVTVPDKSRLFVPISFLLRNAIELSLKRLLVTRTDFCVEKKLQMSKIHSHLLYKDLWSNIKPIIVHYAKENSDDLKHIEIADEYVKVLDSLDKKGDAFRYPVNYGIQYRFVDQFFCLENVYCWLQEIFNFLDACNSSLSDHFEYECEMKSLFE